MALLITTALPSLKTPLAMPRQKLAPTLNPYRTWSPHFLLTPAALTVAAICTSVGNPPLTPLPKQPPIPGKLPLLLIPVPLKALRATLGCSTRPKVISPSMVMPHSLPTLIRVPLERTATTVIHRLLLISPIPLVLISLILIANRPQTPINSRPKVTSRSMAPSQQLSTPKLLIQPVNPPLQQQLVSKKASSLATTLLADHPHQ